MFGKNSTWFVLNMYKIIIKKLRTTILIAEECVILYGLDFVPSKMPVL